MSLGYYGCIDIISIEQRLIIHSTLTLPNFLIYFHNLPHLRDLKGYLVAFFVGSNNIVIVLI